MKRWNFAGLEASHGVSVCHRCHGSTGGRQDPGRTFKNKKMAGHLGVERVTTQNLKVVATDAERGLIMIKGAVPGAEGGYVLVTDAVKRKRPKDAPFPAAVRKAEAPRRRAEARRNNAMKVAVKTLDNKQAGEIELADEVFGLPARKDILARVVHWQLAKRRAGHAQDQGHRRGLRHGKKPWRQKGTRPRAPGLDCAARSSAAAP